MTRSASRRLSTVRGTPDSLIRFIAQGETLIEFLKRTDHVQTLIGPLGSAKTTTTIFKLVQQWSKAPVDPADGVRRSRWAAVRNTYPDLTTTTIRDFLELVEPLDIGNMTYGSPPTYKAKFMAHDGVQTEVEVFFLAFDIPKDVKKARGLRLSGVWFNELKELSKSNVDMVLSRVGRYRPDLLRKNPDCWYGAFGDSNAPDSDHWLAKMVKLKPQGWWFGIQPGAVYQRGGKFHVNKSAENLNNLAPGYYERMMAGKDEYWIRQNLGNEFVFYADGRPVHPTFSQNLHVSPYELEAMPGIDLTLGFDFGRTPAGVICQRQPDGQWYVLDEMIGVNTSARPFGKIFLKQLLNKDYEGFDYESTGDPAGGAGSPATDDTPLDMLSLSIETFGAYTNDFDIRVDALDGLLSELIDGKPAIVISPRCPVLIKGLAGAYQFQRVQVAGDDRFHDKPLKDDTSHVVEALHYALMGAGEGADLVSDNWTRQYERVVSEQGGWHPDPSHFE